MRMDMRTETGPHASALDDLEEAVLRHATAAFIHEHRAVGFRPELLERGNLVLFQRVSRVLGVLAAQDLDLPGLKIDLVPVEHRDDSLGPQAMPVRHKAHSHISM